MSNADGVGLRQVVGGGTDGELSYGVIPFDKNGVCSGPQTRDAIVAEAANATDVFVFSHGWNNDWAAANARYARFIEEYTALRERGWPHPSRLYRPLAVGIFWPSTALVVPWERAPEIAATPGVGDDPSEELRALGDALSPTDAERLYGLADRDVLMHDEALELVALLVPAVGDGPDELDLVGTSAEDLLAVWAAAPADGAAPPVSTATGGFADGGDSSPDAGPAAAGLLDRLDPRSVLRLATVLQMKDRAGRVGAHGVADLLARLNASAPNARVHLVGHSYGGKVVLSALCAAPDPGPRVDSVLLLQPAVSCYCFAAKVPGASAAAGYAVAPDRSRQPIVTTFSARDVPLTQFFHWAARRRADLGETRIAGLPPSRYAALGGYGPQGRDDDTVVVSPSLEPQRYAFDSLGKRIVAIDAGSVIHGHGDVANAATAWALLSQVMEVSDG